MNDAGTVNSQVLDSVAQEATAVVGQAPAGTTGMLDAVMAETIGMAMYNAVTTQHNAQMVASAAIAATCARMLRIPGALPLPFKLIAPGVSAVIPSPVWVSTDNQQLQVIGTNFQPNLHVDVFAPDGSKAGTVSGGQITGVSIPVSFTMTTNLFIQEGTYGIEVVNHDEGRSSRYQIQVESHDPQITGISAAPNGPPNTYLVSGSYFQPGVTANVADHTGTLLSGTTVSNVTSTSFSVLIVPGTSTGPFSIQAVNSDGGSSKAFLVSSLPTTPSVANAIVEQPDWKKSPSH